MESLPASPGTYVLVLQLPHPTTLQAGALGAFTCQPGTYLYVGSAQGPGGLQSRLSHHLQVASPPHWHIDYLRLHAQIAQIWYTIDNPCEHAWAAALADLPDSAIPIPRFGASDCRCPVHLFAFTSSTIDSIAIQFQRSIECPPITMVLNPLSLSL